MTSIYIAPINIVLAGLLLTRQEHDIITAFVSITLLLVALIILIRASMQAHEAEKPTKHINPIMPEIRAKRADYRSSKLDQIINDDK